LNFIKTFIKKTVASGETIIIKRQPMLEKSKYFLCILSIAFSIGSNLHAQTLSRVLGGDGIAIDSRSQPYRAVTLYVPQILTGSYSLSLPSTPPTGPLSLLASDVNGNMSWTTSGTGTLPPLPPNNIWVGNSLSVAMPYAPTVAGAMLTLNNSLAPTWSTSIPPNITISVSQLTTGTLQSGVTFNVGNNSTIVSTGGTIIANNLNGAGNGKYAGNASIPLNAISLNIPYPGIQSGCAVSIIINDPNLPGVAVFLNSVMPGVGFKVDFSAPYPTNTGVVTYIVVNP
jgi:hypothetical protein